MRVHQPGVRETRAGQRATARARIALLPAGTLAAAAFCIVSASALAPTSARAAGGDGGSVAGSGQGLGGADSTTGAGGPGNDATDIRAGGGGGGALTLRSRLASAHDWVSDPTLTPLFQTLPGASFVVNGAAPAKNSALASAGAELRLAGGVALLAKFDGEFAAHSSTYAGTGTLRYTW
jgi:hypothetical protein